MHEAGTLKAEQFCLAADATFKVEVDQRVYTVLTIPAYRKLQGCWRQSRWPVLLLRRTKERFQCYRLAFRAVKEELARLKLPPLRQVHCDYFPGLPRVAREELQEASAVCDVGHMFANFRKQRVVMEEGGEPATEQNAEARQGGFELSQQCSHFHDAAHRPHRVLGTRSAGLARDGLERLKKALATGSSWLSWLSLLCLRACLRQCPARLRLF